MFYCLFIKPKLFEYANDQLNKSQIFKIEKHLKHCTDCQKVVEQYKNIMAVYSKDKPILNNAFWESFDVQLDKKLLGVKDVNAIKIDCFKFKTSVFSRLALASAIAVCLIIVIGVTSFNDRLFHNLSDKGLSEDNLIETALLIDEFDEIELTNDEDALVEEFIFQILLEDA